MLPHLIPEDTVLQIKILDTVIVKSERDTQTDFHQIYHFYMLCVLQTGKASFQEATSLP